VLISHNCYTTFTL